MNGDLKRLKKPRINARQPPKRAQTTVAPADINARNKVFWKLAIAEFERLADRYPHRLDEIAERVTRNIKAGHISDVAYAEDVSLEASIFKFSALLKKDRSIDASANAQAPRPKKYATVKSVAIKKMTPWRAEGRRLRDFLDAAEARSVDGFSVSTIGDKITVDAELEHDQVVALRTLKDWWKEAKSKSRAD